MPIIGRHPNSINKLLASMNWLLVIAGFLLVGETAHTLFFSPSSSYPFFVSTVNSSSEPVTGAVRPVVRGDADGAKVEDGASPEPSSLPSSTLESRPSKARRTPRVRNPNPDRLFYYDGPPASEADRLGL